MAPATYRKVTLGCVWLLGAIILTGALVRLTGSGLGCSDWPTCENQSVVGDYGYHGWIEYANRLVTGLVSLIVVLAVLGSRRRRPRRDDLVRWSWGLVAGVAAQILLGAAVVYLELDPRVVIGHFLVSMVLVWNAVALHHLAGRPEDGRHPGWVTVDSSAAVLVRLVVVAAVAVIVAGTIVTGSGPHAGSLDEPIQRLPFAPVDVARIHSGFVWVLVALTVALRWRLARSEQPAKRRVDRVIAVLIAQGTIGYVQYALDVPIGLVALHIVGAVTLWIAVIDLGLTLRGSDDRVTVSTIPA